MRDNIAKIIALCSTKKGSKCLWLGLIVASAVFAICWDQVNAQASKTVGEKSSTALDTFIPAGFVLVPIQAVNYDSLDSILGPYGIVDLFQASQDAKMHAKKVASRVKILRAPQNPSQFAVLVRSQDADRIVSGGGSYFVVIQNTKETGTGFVVRDGTGSSAGRHSRIIMEAPNDSSEN